MNEITVSIVCTNYNKGDWIAEAIESFLRQDANFKYEILVIDDASTDHSPEVIRGYAQKYPETIRAFFNKKNLGITKTWTKVCKEARGKYIARCDGDDYWIDDKKLQKQVDLLKKHKDSLWCSTDYNIITPEGKLKDVSAFENKLVDRSSTYAEMLVTKGFTMSSTWLVDTNLMREINDSIDSSAVDDTFNIQLDLFNKTKLTYLPEPTVVYRVNDGSDSRPIEIEKIRSRHERLLKTQLEYIEKYKDVDYAEMLKILLNRNLQNEMWAIERLQIVYDQRKHIKNQENTIEELKAMLDVIENSQSYQLARSISRVAKLPVRISGKALRLIERTKSNLRYEKDRKKKLRSKDQLKQERILSEKFSYTPLISIVVPVYNVPETFFLEMVDSVKNQTYQNWELILIDDASPVKDVQDLISRVAEGDDRIVYKFLKTNQHIAGATNEGIFLSKGEFVSLFDHDDLLHPSALYEIVKLLNNNSDVDFIYTDEEKIAGKNKYIQPFIKPDWNPELLHSTNYIMHFTTIRKTILNKYGQEDAAFNGAQDWELFLRITRNISPDRIAHIPKILYSWRIHKNSTADVVENKPYVAEAQKKSIQADLYARGYQDFALHRHPQYSGQWEVEFSNQIPGSVLIVVDDKQNIPQITDQLNSNTPGVEYKIITDSKDTTYRHILQDGYKYVAFVGGGLSLSDPKWLNKLAADASRSEVGIVLAGVSDKEVMSNLRPMLGADRVKLIERMGNENVSKRLYKTARYNIKSVNSEEGIMVVSADKISQSISDLSIAIDRTELSVELTKHGYSNLYNPCVKVLK